MSYDAPHWITRSAFAALTMLTIAWAADAQVTCSGSDPNVLDCNGNGTDDHCDIAGGTSQDCNTNGIPDECDMGPTALQWSLRTAGGPSPRNGHAMAYDRAREVTVLFGGETGAVFSDETWHWDGTSWNQRIVAGPTPRKYHAMSYDSGRDVVLLFGGRTDPNTASVKSNETWEWNGITWRLRASSGPSAQASHAMAYDNRRGVTVLLGVGSSLNHSETWEWNRARWSLRSTSGPSWRTGHALAFDSARGVVVLFGGYSPNGVDMGDTWEWDGDEWTLRSNSGPSRRRGHAMTYDSARRAVILFGGHDSTAPFDNGDTWEWDGNAWSPRGGQGPGLRYQHAIVYDVPRRTTFVFGGRNNNQDRFGDTWGSGPSSGDCNANGIPDDCLSLEIDCNSNLIPDACEIGQDCNHNGIADSCDLAAGTSRDCNANGFSDDCDVGAERLRWDKASNGGPAPRYDHAMAYDTVRSVAVLFGGRTNFSPYANFGVTWEWNGHFWRLRATAGPSPRVDHAMAYDSGRGVVVLFGGYATNGLSRETWEWDGSAWLLRNASGPSATEYHAMAYDQARGMTVLFGGYGTAGQNDETWEWDGVAWVRREVGGPSARKRHAMAYDSRRHVVVLFGGFNDYLGSFQDTWEWDGNSWTLKANTGPSRRMDHAMAYDSARGMTVLVGGTTLNRETWEWDGEAWTRRIIGGPSGRSSHALAFDRARRTMVLFGGYDEAGVDGETWTWTTDTFDCNANGVPDECESNVLCARVVSAGGWQSHGTVVGMDRIVVNVGGRLALANVTSEPRSGGIVELRIAFDSPPGGPGPMPLNLEQRTCDDGGDYAPYSGNAVVSSAIEGNELVLQFTPALENARTYRITLGPDISAAAGQSIEVRGLVGDVNSDGQVNGGDRSQVIGVWTGAGYSPATDLDQSGQTNGLDRTLVIAAWTQGPNCAP